MTSQGLSWYILCTKPRNEKKVVKHLSEAGYIVYCPLKKISRQWSDRTKVIEEPLFPSYIFIQIDDHRREEVFSYHGIVRYLFWCGRPAKVCQEEINIIQKWLGEFKNEDIDISDIRIGDLVRITTGQFSGEEGLLLYRSKHKVVVQLKELGIQLSLSLANNDLLALKNRI